MDRRKFVQIAGAAPALAIPPGPPHSSISASARRALEDRGWPVLKVFDQDHIARIALPLGGIGTGTVSLYGNGSLRDWEVMNRPAKGFTPAADDVEPFFALYVDDGKRSCGRVLEGPLPPESYEGSHGSRAPSVNLPRFRGCEFAASYPFGRVLLSDPDLPVTADLKAYNPMVPADPDASGIPVAVLTFEIRNRAEQDLTVAVAATLPNFIGVNGWEDSRDWKGDRHPTGARRNRNHYRRTARAQGIFMDSAGVDAAAETFGTLALATTAAEGVSWRTAWAEGRWGGPMLDFWEDFIADGRLDAREPGASDMPIASLAVRLALPARSSCEITFLIAWRFPNRYGWNVAPEQQTPADRVGNYYCTQYADAWDVIEKVVSRLPDLTRRTADFVAAFISCSLPPEVKEAALFNLSTLRTQTCFRTEDGRFFGWEGCADQKGCCQGSCTHVWNYEQATAYLYGSLAMSMRDTEFAHATNDEGAMSFRVQLPLERAQEFGRVAADGQMGCIMKMYRDWQLSGDDAALRRLWPNVRRALEFCWIEGGWDGDRDGVMEGVQHNTMDVEYFGPNPQMGFWYLGALRAAEEMARYLGDSDFADTCRSLFERGARWIDDNLFDGEYYQHQVRPVRDPSRIPPYFLVGMGSTDLANPDYQLASGCLVDQLVGQFMAHVCGLGHLARRNNIVRALQSIRKYNYRETLYGHFNPLRTFALAGEKALLMACYPKGRPAKPFPYFAEVMTGFEYTAAVGMLYEGLIDEGLECIRNIRDRYDGRKRSPYDEAECGHHYARAMASWAAVPALTGFRYSAVTRALGFAPKPGLHFYSTGYAWGRCSIELSGGEAHVRLDVQEGRLPLSRVEVAGFAARSFPEDHVLGAGQWIDLVLRGS